MADDNRISDEGLVSAMAAGDQDALATLNQRYGRALSAVAARILRDEADAEEVAADVLWQLWREASRFDRGRGSVGAIWAVFCEKGRCHCEERIARRSNLVRTSLCRPEIASLRSQ